MTVRKRPVARVVLIDAADRILLLDHHLAYTRVWMTPGGALQAGESPEAAAARELWEETGVVGVSLGPCIWRVRFKFQHEGFVYEQDEHYFAGRVQSSAVSGVNREQAELTEIREHRWWSPSEIASSVSHFRPRGLSSLLPSVLAGDYPDEPLIAQVEGCAQLA